MKKLYLSLLLLSSYSSYVLGSDNDITGTPYPIFDNEMLNQVLNDDTANHISESKYEEYQDFKTTLMDELQHGRTISEITLDPNFSPRAQSPFSESDFTEQNAQQDTELENMHFMDFVSQRSEESDRDAIDTILNGFVEDKTLNLNPEAFIAEMQEQQSTATNSYVRTDNADDVYFEENNVLNDIDYAAIENGDEYNQENLLLLIKQEQESREDQDLAEIFKRENIDFNSTINNPCDHSAFTLQHEDKKPAKRKPGRKKRTHCESDNTQDDAIFTVKRSKDAYEDTCMPSTQDSLKVIAPHTITTSTSSRTSTRPQRTYTQSSHLNCTSSCCMPNEKIASFPCNYFCGRMFTTRQGRSMHALLVHKNDVLKSFDSSLLLPLLPAIQPVADNN